MDIDRWGLTDGYRLARTVGRHLGDRTRYTAEEFITAAERAAEEHPNEWVIFYTLGDKYQDVGRYGDALSACRRCVDLRPNDVRSVYALATAYNMLVRATLPLEPTRGAAAVMSGLLGRSDLLVSDPAVAIQQAQKGLGEVGLTVEVAACQAMRWFEHALAMHPDQKSCGQIRQDLVTLYRRFPHLSR
ncbi:MAG: tetratricopeptide repeat protein [Anaerolineae bacterium]